MGHRYRRVGSSGLLSAAIHAAASAGRAPVIVDLKPVSPRDGGLLHGRSAPELGRALVGAGACALSVVTEATHFGGNCELLAEVASAVDVPVLRKDFLSTAAQVDESHACGARAVLLILATTSDVQAAAVYARAVQLGMEVLVEVHSAAELERAVPLSPTLIGINNRDILQLERDSGDVRVTEELARRVPDGITVLSESALLTAADMRRALAAGADAVLVGTAILQAGDPPARLAQFLAALAAPATCRADG